MSDLNRVKNEFYKDEKLVEIKCRLNVSMQEYKLAWTIVGRIRREPETLYGSIPYTPELVFDGSYLLLNRIELQSYDDGSINIFSDWNIRLANNRIKLNQISYNLTSEHVAGKDYKAEIEQSFRSQFKLTFDLIEEVNRQIREDAKIGVNLVC